MNILLLEVWRECESRNAYNRPSGHWLLHSHKKAWEKAINDALMMVKANGHFPTAFIGKCEEKRSVHIIAYRQRLIDPDNVSIKALMDALKRLGLIYDDSAKWVEISVMQFSCGKKVRPYTLIEMRKNVKP